MTKLTLEITEMVAITVPHQGKSVTFVGPPIGPGTYDQVGKEIDEAGLLRPTFAETVSFIYSATRNRGEYAQNVLDTFNERWFWGFSTVRNEHKEGVFISDRNRKDIHVPFGFKTGEQSLDELVKNPFILALAEDEEGAEKLAKIAESQKITPRIWSLEIDSTVNRCSALSANRYGESSGCMSIASSYFNFDGCAFGVEK